MIGPLIRALKSARENKTLLKEKKDLLAKKINQLQENSNWLLKEKDLVLKMGDQSLNGTDLLLKESHASRKESRKPKDALPMDNGLFVKTNAVLREMNDRLLETND